MATYEMVKNAISRDKARGKKLDGWKAKLDMFLMFDRLTAEQYEELMNLLGAKEAQTEPEAQAETK